MESGWTDDRVRWRFINGHEPLGEFGEGLWANIINGCGLHYMKLADLPIINRQGPRLQGSGAILPDFHVSGLRNALIDSKCKTGPVLFRKAMELRHGIDRKDWESYSEVSGIQRTKCAVAICELFERDDSNEWRGALLMQSLARLGSPVSGFSNQSHMVYWPRNRFAVVASGTSPLRLWRLAHGEIPPDNETKSAVLDVLGKREDIQSRMW